MENSSHSNLTNAASVKPERGTVTLAQLCGEWRQRGLELANQYRADQWELARWWLDGRRWSRERIRFVESPTWPGPRAKRLRIMAYDYRRLYNVSLYKDVLSFSAHEVVASLNPEVAVRFLDRALTQGLTVEGLKAAVAAYRQSQQPLEPNTCTLTRFTHKFPTILADPPWGFDHPAVDRSIRRHYPTLPIGDIMQLPVADLATRDAHLFLWVPNALLPEGLAVMNCWGFPYAANMVWIKQRRGLGTGNYWRYGHELLLLGLRGDAGDFLDKTLASHLTAPPGRHSAKPDEVREMIERAVPGPYLELFARSRREGWEVWPHIGGS